jgi:hypothetical protein
MRGHEAGGRSRATLVRDKEKSGRTQICNLGSALSPANQEPPTIDWSLAPRASRSGTSTVLYSSAHPAARSTGLQYRPQPDLLHRQDVHSPHSTRPCASTRRALRAILRGRDAAGSRSSKTAASLSSSSLETRLTRTVDPYTACRVTGETPKQQNACPLRMPTLSSPVTLLLRSPNRFVLLSNCSFIRHFVLRPSTRLGCTMPRHRSSHCKPPTSHVSTSFRLWAAARPA